MRKQNSLVYHVLNLTNTPVLSICAYLSNIHLTCKIGSVFYLRLKFSLIVFYANSLPLFSMERHDILMSFKLYIFCIMSRWNFQNTPVCLFRTIKCTINIKWTMNRIPAQNHKLSFQLHLWSDLTANSTSGRFLRASHPDPGH